MFAPYAKVTEDGIYGFFNNYRFLSNFFLADIIWEGITYPSTEHAFQAGKTLDPAVRQSIANHPLKGVKAAGKKIILRPDWETEVAGIKTKVRVMRELNLIKFSTHANLKISLLATAPKYLEETNSWNDQIWGVCYKTGKGTNLLGHTLMFVRETLKS